MIPITATQADIIFKALYYTAREEGIETSDKLTEIYEVLAEENPKDTHASHTTEVMEYLSNFIKNSSEYNSYLSKDNV